MDAMTEPIAWSPITTTPTIEFHQDVIYLPFEWSEPKHVHVSPNADVFDRRLRQAAIALIFSVMQASPQHTFYLITGRPQRMAWALGPESPWDILRGAFTPPSPNVHLGIRVFSERHRAVLEPWLRKTPATARFVVYGGDSAREYLE